MAQKDNFLLAQKDNFLDWEHRSVRGHWTYLQRPSDFDVPFADSVGGPSHRPNAATHRADYFARLKRHRVDTTLLERRLLELE
jgi:hypothetical protein